MLARLYAVLAVKKRNLARLAAPGLLAFAVSLFSHGVAHAACAYDDNGNLIDSNTNLTCVEVTGQVTDQDGAPLRNVSVTATDPGATNGLFGGMTGADGTYDIYVAPGTYDFHYSLVTRTPSVSVTLHDVTVFTDQIVNARMSATYHTYSGHLLKQDGTPLSAHVLIYGGARPFDAYTDSAGGFSIKAYPDTYGLAVVGTLTPGDGINSSDFDIGSNGTVADLTSSDVQQDLVLNTEIVNANVVDTAGNPVPNEFFQVGYSNNLQPTFQGAAEFDQTNTSSGYTDASGHYVVEMIQPYGPFSVYLNSNRYNGNTAVQGYFSGALFTVVLDTDVPPEPTAVQMNVDQNNHLIASWSPVPSADHFVVSFYHTGLNSATVASRTIANTSSNSYDGGAIAGDGRYYANVFSVNEAGLGGNNLTGADYLVDTTPPTLGFVAFSVNPKKASETSGLSIKCTGALTSCNYVEYFVDNDPGQGKGTPMLQSDSDRTLYLATIGTNLTSGTHNIGVRANDENGNWTSVTAATLTVESNIAAPIGLVGQSPTNSPELSWDPVSGADHYNVYRDGVLVGLSNLTSYADNGSMVDGSHTYKVTAVDLLGTESAQSSPVTVVVDKTVPVVSALSWSANPLVQGQSTILSAVVSDGLSGVSGVSYSVDGGALQAMTYDSASGTWKATFGSGLAVNTYNVNVVAMDAAGNVSAGKTDVLAVYNAANGYVTGHEWVAPGAADTLPIARDTGVHPAQVVLGFTNVKAATSTTPTSGSFDVHYVVKNNQEEFGLSSTGVDWLVVPDSTHASILGHADLTKYVGGVKTVIQNVAVRFDVSLGAGGDLDHVTMKIFDPGVYPNTGAPHWVVSDDALANVSHMMIMP